MSRQGRHAWKWILGLLLAVPAAARADSVRDAVRSHVSSSLPSSSSSSSDDDDDDDDDGPQSRSEVAGGAVWVGDTRSGGGEVATWPWAAVARAPLQVDGRAVQLEATVETVVTAWKPAQHPAVRIDAAGYRTYRLELSGEVAGLFALRRLAIETDGQTWFGRRRSAVRPFGGGALGSAGQAVVEIGIPALLGRHGAWIQPILRYESAAFATVATPTRPVCLVARDADTSLDPPACASTGGPLRMTSTFESFVAGVQLGERVGPGAFASLHLGLDVTAQRKPYQVDVDGRTLGDFLFDARFRGLGFAGGFHLGQAQGLQIDAGLRVGAAWVSLTDDLQLEDVLPAGWNLEYVRWQAEVAYAQPLWSGPPVLLLRAGLGGSGSHFRYSHPELERAPSLSQDLFLAGRLALILLF